MELPNKLKVWQWNKGETEWLYEEIFEDDLYTSKQIKLNPGAVVFDCGANIGMFAVFCHHKTGGDVEVHSFEPMPKIHAVCAANARKFTDANGKKCLHTYQVRATCVAAGWHAWLTTTCFPAGCIGCARDCCVRFPPSLLHLEHQRPQVRQAA